MSSFISSVYVENNECVVAILQPSLISRCTSLNFVCPITKTKTLYSERVIKLPQSVYEVLIERLKTSQSEWIFPHPKDTSKPMPGDIALRRLRKILESAGLPHIRFHDLRHTFATHAVSAGIDPKTLS